VTAKHDIKTREALQWVCVDYIINPSATDFVRARVRNAPFRAIRPNRQLQKKCRERTHALEAKPN